MTDRAPSSSRRASWLVRVLPVLALAALFSVALARFTQPVSFHGTAYEPPEPAHDFRLVDQAGREARLSDHRGKVVLLFFGYTHCPDVCPMTLTRLQRVLDSVGAGPDDARVVMVSVDPERDTPEALSRYLQRFGGQTLGLTGTPEELAPVYKAYHVYAEARPAAAGAGAHSNHGGTASGTMVGHTDAVFGIDRQGQIRVLLRPDNPDEILAADVRTLLGL